MEQLSRRRFLRNSGIATVAAGGLATLPSVAPALAGGRGHGLGTAGPNAGPTPTGAGQTWVGYVNDQGGQVYNVTNPAYGAQGDTLRFTSGGAITAGSQIFTGSGASFTPADVGKVITIQGAGTSSSVLTATITAWTSASVVTISVAAGTPQTSAPFNYGTDDTQALVKAIAAAGATGVVYVPAGTYTILASSNGGKPITHAGRGGITGRGGRYTPGTDVKYSVPNTVFLCSDRDAGLLANGGATYEGFMCDGNLIANKPLQIGVASNNAVTAAPSFATFRDVRANASTGAGWTVLGVKNSAFYDCGSTHNVGDGVYIDGAASNLDFFHFEEWDNGRYGLHGDHLVTPLGGAAGTVQPTQHVRFYSGLCDGGGSQTTVSKVYLRAAYHWAFPAMIIVGNKCSGAAIDVDQSEGYDLDFTGCWIYGTSPNPCIQIAGTAPTNNTATFIKTGECSFFGGGNSVFVSSYNSSSSRFSAHGGWYDSTSNGPAAAAGLPAVDTMFAGRTGLWQNAPTGSAAFRIMGEGWVALRGNVTAAAGVMFNLPAGYRPIDAARHIPVAASSGAAVLTITTGGDVSVSPAGGGTFPSGTTVYFDGVSFTR